MTCSKGELATVLSFRLEIDIIAVQISSGANPSSIQPTPTV